MAKIPLKQKKLGRPIQGSMVASLMIGSWVPWQSHEVLPTSFSFIVKICSYQVNLALGDFYFKLSAIYTHRVFLNTEPGFQSPDKVRSFISRNLTPPYLSGVPDVRHIDLTALKSSEVFLILCTDGLMDCYDDDRLKLQDDLGPRWVRHVGKQSREQGNLALSLLRDALGGNDMEKVSRVITVEMSFRWMDDTTILVQRL
jgi:pyruvate dehydrogenase phosphatase